jgi:translation initiation factor 3 subunit M
MRPQLIFVDGTWADQAQELADYVQVGDQVRPLLEKEQNDEALKIIVNASSHLNSVPEKEFTAAYNLLIYVVLQSKDPKPYLPTICSNLLKPITSSPAHGFTLASNALTTIFNLLDDKNRLRMHVFMHILKFVKQQGQFEVFKPTLKNLEQWLKDWEADEEEQLHIYEGISDAAAEAHDEE